MQSVGPPQVFVPSGFFLRLSALGVRAWVSFAFGLTAVGGLGARLGVQHTLPLGPWAGLLLPAASEVDAFRAVQGRPRRSSDSLQNKT